MAGCICGVAVGRAMTGVEIRECREDDLGALAATQERLLLGSAMPRAGHGEGAPFLVRVHRPGIAYCGTGLGRGAGQCGGDQDADNNGGPSDGDGNL